MKITQNWCFEWKLSGAARGKIPSHSKQAELFHFLLLVMCEK